VICRYKRPRAPPLASQGKRVSSTKRATIGCDVTFALLAFSDHYEYWPIGKSGDEELVTCVRHSHSLDESDAYKRNSFLRHLIGAEVANGYPLAAVIGSLAGQGRADARVRLAAAGGAYLTRQDVINAGLTWRLANPNRLWVIADLKDDVSLQGSEALETLANLGWKVSQISATSLDHVAGQGLVFADPASLRTLEAHGRLSLIDSTHKTNQLE
jgi:hypothetical protein